MKLKMQGKVLLEALAAQLSRVQSKREALGRFQEEHRTRCEVRERCYALHQVGAVLGAMARHEERIARTMQLLRPDEPYKISLREYHDTMAECPYDTVSVPSSETVHGFVSTLEDVLPVGHTPHNN